MVHNGGHLERHRPGAAAPSDALPPPLASLTATFRRTQQITHIQFLTLLYPSDLEARLIFGLLGEPLT